MMTQDPVLCLVCQNPIPAQADRFERAGGAVHLECDQRRPPVDITIMRVLGHQPNAQGGCTLIFEGEVGGTVQTAWRLTLPTGREVAAVQAIVNMYR